ncbi:MAG: hypothetical protein BWY79_01268 [Actinobacteria bacterium ADurb.Bin444]|nr:MAG: hypothetical protein BWY79_01268 [Actinobacteria bacterium ADurb.Bin444]
MDGDGVLEGGVGHGIEDGSEGLFLDNGHVRPRFDDGGLHVEAAGVIGRNEWFASAEQPPALLLGLRHCSQIVLNGVTTHQRPHQHAGFQRITHPHRPVHRRQTINQVAINALLGDESARGRATLAGGGQSTEGHSAHRRSHVRLGGDHRRVVPAQFQQAPAQAGRHFLGHQPAGGHGARERDQGQASILEHAVAHYAAAAHDEEEDGGMAQLLQHLIGHPHHSYGSQRSLRRRLPDRYVADYGGDERVPRPDGRREVESGDHADGSQRMPLFLYAMMRAFARHGEPVELAGEPHREVADIDHLLNLALAFHYGLTHL